MNNLKEKKVCIECTADPLVCEYCIYSKKEIDVEDNNAENIINLNNEKYDGKSKKYCPICKKIYASYPATSRKDNKTLICSDCGMKEIQEPFEDLLFENDILIY